MKKIALVIFVSFISTYSFNQKETETPPKWGLSAAVQNSSIGFQLPVWLGESIIIAPSLGAAYRDNFGWELQFGIAPRFFLNKNNLRPYLGFKVASIIDLPSKVNATDILGNPIDFENTIDLIGGLSFGGEYFFSNHFSIGLEIQANVIKSDENSLRFGNPGGINFNTGALALINIYF